MATKILAENEQYHSRGEFGNWITKLTLVGFDPETNSWVPDENGSAWAAWDSDWGWLPNFYVPVEKAG